MFTTTPQNRPLYTAFRWAEGDPNVLVGRIVAWRHEEDRTSYPIVRCGGRTGVPAESCGAHEKEYLAEITAEALQVRGGAL